MYAFNAKKQTNEDDCEYDVQADCKTNGNTVVAEETLFLENLSNNEIISSNDTPFEFENVLDSLNEVPESSLTNTKNVLEEKNNNLSTHDELNTPNPHAEDPDLPKKTEIRSIEEPIVFSNIEELRKEVYDISTDTIIVNAEVHSIPEKNRIKIIDVKIIQPAENLINFESNMPKNAQVENYNTKLQINEIKENYLLTDLDAIEEEVIIDMDLEVEQKADDGNTENSSENSKKRKERKRKAKELANKSHLDFVSDDDVAEYEWDSSSWEGSEVSDSEDGQNQARKKKSKNKAKRQKVTREEDETVSERGLKKEKQPSKKKIRSNAGKLGKEYETASGCIVAEKEMKSNPCTEAKKCPFNCKDIPEEKRKNLFAHFNGLTLQRKRDWLSAMIMKEFPKRKRNEEATGRQYSYLYFVNDGEGRRPVCLRFLLSTLNVTQKFVHYTLSHSVQGSGQEDMRGQGIPANKTKSETITSVKQFIMSLPAVPSHYCRQDSSRVYLPSEMINLANLYEHYKKKQQQDGVDFVAEKVFRNIFSTDFNIGFHVPKKDKCSKCVAYNEMVKMNTLDEKTKAEKEKHDLERKTSDERFKFHKTIRVKDKSTLCVSFDMQKVLNTPMGKNMLLFYSRKYAVYNLTFYESVTRNGYCYTWGESEGKRGANEVASILVKYVEELDKRNEAQNILFYCDSCPGQNKNKTVLAALHYVLQRCVNILTIQINYLLPGHTMMPVDSLHAVIENSVNATVWAPSQWSTIFQLARKSFGPYNVTVLDHKDFLRYDKSSDKYFKGNLTGKISKLTTVTIKKNKTQIKIKYSTHPESPAETIDVTGSFKQLLQIYKSSLPIPEKKYADLTQLCNKNVIPKQYHSEYKNMQSKKIEEVLMESDEEDNNT